MHGFHGLVGATLVALHASSSFALPVLRNTRDSVVCANGSSDGPLSTSNASWICASHRDTPPRNSAREAAPDSASASTLAQLFPVSGSSKWTTFPSSGALPLSDATLRPFDVESGVTHSYVAAPDGKQAMQAHFPKGSYIPSKQPRGGFSFYAPGPGTVDFTTAKTLTFGYSVMFPKGFQFNLGGKLPGIYGGDDAKTAISCSGGRRDPTCFSARLMWRPDGAGELYTYLPDPSDTSKNFTANARICKLAHSTCNPTYGASIGRGQFSFTPGAWTTVSERMTLNTVSGGQPDANGAVELFVGGTSVINATGIIIRDSDEGRMRGMQMQTFFGGSTPNYASPVDQDAYFADFSVAIIETL